MMQNVKEDIRRVGRTISGDCMMQYEDVQPLIEISWGHESSADNIFNLMLNAYFLGFFRGQRSQSIKNAGQSGNSLSPAK